MVEGENRVDADHGGGGKNDRRTLLRAHSEDPGHQRPADAFDTPRFLLRSARPGSSASESPADLLTALYRMVADRAWLVFGTPAIAMAATAIVLWNQTPLYVADARIQINASGIKIIEAGETFADLGVSRSELRTHIELLRSQALARRVATRLKLQDDTAFLAPRDGFAWRLFRRVLRDGATGPLDGGTSSAREGAAASIVAENVTIEPVPGARLIDIRYRDPDAERAAAIANAYAQAFIRANIDRRFAATSYAKSVLEDRIAGLKERLATSEKRLLSVSESQDTNQVGAELPILERQIQQADDALGELVAARIKKEQLWRQAQQVNGAALPQILNSKIISDLRAQRNTISTQYKEKLEVFKPTYPAMVELSNKKTEIDRQISGEVAVIRASLKSAYDLALRRENEMGARVATLKTALQDQKRRNVNLGILARDVESNRNLYNSLLQRLKEVDVASDSEASAIFIVDAARQPSRPAEPRMGRALAVAFSVGLGLSFSLAYLLEVTNDRIRQPGSLEHMSGLPVLGLIPEAPDDGPPIAALSNPDSQLSEAYRSLAMAVGCSAQGCLPRSVLVTSPDASQATALTAIAIARHYAASGSRVLLVDANMREPSLHIALNADNHVGLSSYLDGRLAPPAALQRTNMTSLALMTSGPAPANAADLLSGPRLHALVSIASETFDVVIIDGPTLLGVADAQFISRATAATLLVVRSGEARAGDVTLALHRLAHSNARVIGTVLTGLDARSIGYGQRRALTLAAAGARLRDNQATKRAARASPRRRAVATARETPISQILGGIDHG